MGTPTQPLTIAQASTLAQEFHDISAAIGAYRIAEAAELTAVEQFQLQNAQLQCTQFSNHFITMGLFAQQANLDDTLSVIQQQTEKAEAAISTINTVDKVLQVVTAAAVLGASIASMNPSAIATGVGGLANAVIGSSSNSSGSGS